MEIETCLILPKGALMTELLVGQTYLFESSARMWIGRVHSIDGPYTVTLTDASWVAETGRLHVFIRGGLTPETEVEPVGTMGVQWIAWIHWPHELPKEAQ